MTKATTPESKSNGAAKSPSHFVYQVRERDGKPDFWNRIGVAFPHRDEQGFNIQLESVPLDGRIVLRIASEN
ncbi:MAG: hypothetical protein Q8K78_02085 [Planctomycetaceae bacterium]|nr:hypothetical protein [Planctomycetaceae bacterium]